MKTFDKQAAQGDILITRIDGLPDGLQEQKPTQEGHIVAHSETGHHHTLPAKGVQLFAPANDPMVLYVVVDDECADLVHNRSYDTHETIRLKQGNYEIRRQREYIPEGWRRVAD